jgi:hypothetical protein
MQLLRSAQVAAPAAILALAGAVGGPLAVPGAEAAGWSAPACPAGEVAREVAPGTWYRLDPLLDDSGTLAGRRLLVGAPGRTALQLDLPPESSASGPRDGLVLVVDDDGRRSRVRLLDPARACAANIGETGAVVRSAVAEPGTGRVWEHRVDRRSRADLGVWLRDLATGTEKRVLPGLPTSDRFGPTFVTDLAVGADGRLGVSSCGLRTCRTRILDTATGAVEQFEGTGALIGVAGSTAVAWAACPGLPCPILAVNLASGRRGVLVEAAGLAALGGATGMSLVYEAPGGGVSVLEVSTGRVRVAGTRAGLPVRASSLSAGGAETTAGEVPLAPGGRVTSGEVVRVIDPSTRAVSRLGAVLP